MGQLSFPPILQLSNETPLSLHIQLQRSTLREELAPRWQTLVLISYCSLIVLGMLSNLVVCSVVFRHSTRNSHRTTNQSRNLYILNLALADLSLCAFSMPLTVYQLFNVHWTLGIVLCKLAPLLQASNMVVSSGTISAIAIDRYNTIVRSSRCPGKKTLQGSNTSAIAAGMLIFLWILGLAIASPLFFSTHLELSSPNSMKCVEYWSSDSMKLSFSVCLTTVQFILPVIIVSTVHYKISSYLKLHLRKFQRPQIKIQSPLDPDNIKIATDDDTFNYEKQSLHKEYLNINRKESVCSENSQRSESSRKFSDCSDSKTPDISPSRRGRDFLTSLRKNSDLSFSFSILSRESSRKSTKKMRRELKRNKRTTIMLSCIASVYAVSWLPFHVQHILSDLAPSFMDPSTSFKVYVATHLLAMTSVCVNPLFYGWLNTNFRREFKRIFKDASGCFVKVSKKSSLVFGSAKENPSYKESMKNDIITFIHKDKTQYGVSVTLYPDSSFPMNV